MRMRTALGLLVLVIGAVGCVDDYDGGNGFASTTLYADDYVSSCQGPADCVGVAAGEQCGDPCGPCVNAAINVVDYPQYLQDKETIVCEQDDDIACLVPCPSPGVACIAQSCQLVVDNDQTPTVTINETEIFSLNGVDNVVNDVAGTTVLTVRGTEDQQCSVADDETTFTLQFAFDDLSAVPLHEPIALDSDNLPFTVEVAVGCLCQTDAGIAQYSLSGEVQFRELSASSVAGDLLSVVVNGDIPHANGQIYRQDSVLEIDWIGFIAPATDNPCP